MPGDLAAAVQPGGLTGDGGIDGQSESRRLAGAIEPVHLQVVGVHADSGPVRRHGRVGCAEVSLVGVPMFLSSGQGGRFGLAWVVGRVVGGGWLVGGAALEHGEDDVAAPSGEADDGGVVAPAFSAFAVGERL